MAGFTGCRAASGGEGVGAALLSEADDDGVVCVGIGLVRTISMFAVSRGPATRIDTVDDINASAIRPINAIRERLVEDFLASFAALLAAVDRSVLARTRNLFRAPTTNSKGVEQKRRQRRRRVMKPIDYDFGNRWPGKNQDRRE